MQYYVSEEEAQYMDAHKGFFSKKLAEWAINNMKVRDEATGTLKKLSVHPLEEAESALKQHGVKYNDINVYTAWYLFNMAFADYKKALPTLDVKCMYIDETLNDPDGKPESVLACFRAKMDVKDIPIHWERYI